MLVPNHSLRNFVIESWRNKLYKKSWSRYSRGKWMHLKNLKLYGSFFWMGFNCLKARATSRRQFTFYQQVPRNSWYSFYQPRKDERLSRICSHAEVLNMGALDWESSPLTTKPLFHFLVITWNRKNWRPNCSSFPNIIICSHSLDPPF